MRRKNYLWYRFLRHTVVGTGLKFFYSSVKVKGKENLPKNKPILYIPNHQNSFMDALHVATTTWPVIYFLTRAQAFKPSIVGKFLWSLYMLPVYRVRDGLKSVQKNNEIFELCIKYLENKDTVLVFAEANHNLKRRIRSLSKGFTRIAFGAEEEFDWQLDLQIVPVGINYSEHRTGGNLVQVNYGEPIPVKKYRAAYLEDDKLATDEMKEDVSEAMKKLVFHVEDLKEYPVQKILWDDLEPDRSLVIDPDVANHRISNTKPHITPKLTEQANEVQALADKHNIPLRDFAKNDGLSFKEFFLFPFYMFSYFNNLLPYLPIKRLIKKVIKDPAFDASIKFLGGLLFLPLFYTLVSLGLFFSGVSTFTVLIYIVLSIFTAPMFIRSKELFSSDDIQALQRFHPDDYNRILDILNSFQKVRDSILD